MKHVEVFILEPAIRRDEFHTIDTEGNEAKIVVRYNITYDEKSRKWVGGRADGNGATVRTTEFQDLWMLLGTRILEDHFKGPVDPN